jgi:hypothetical protein
MKITISIRSVTILPISEEKDSEGERKKEGRAGGDGALNAQWWKSRGEVG